MTVVGQSRYFRNSLGMSAYAQIADMAHSALAVAMCQSATSLGARDTIQPAEAGSGVGVAR